MSYSPEDQRRVRYNLETKQQQKSELKAIKTSTNEFMGNR